MSVVDHFHKTPDAGFSRSWDAESARRQFNVSLALIAALAFAAGLLAYSLRIGPAPISAPHALVQADTGTGAFGTLVRP
ncbi:MAG: hypothetical protein KGM42_10865 [Hyphomicrobiales bacterium]|nr:hypothetical protein [Hyphomicrobiales bacterium]